MSESRRADLHVHTCFSGWRSLPLIDAQDCYVTPDDAYARARQRGMDFVCISDHNSIDGAVELLGRRPDLEPRVIVAEEVEARFPDGPEWVHLNVFDVDHAIHADMEDLRSDCRELIDYLGRRGLFFVLNHPLQSFHTVASARRRLEELLPVVPGIEVCNSTSPVAHRSVLTALLGVMSGPRPVMVGGSDAHTLSRIGVVHTIAPGQTKGDFLRNVRNGRGTVGGTAPGLATLIRDVYEIIGRYYLQLHGRSPRTRGSRRFRNVLGSGILLPAVVLGVPAVLTSLHHAHQSRIARSLVRQIAWPRRQGGVSTAAARAPEPATLGVPAAIPEDGPA